jgi:hypothetical protein
MEAQAIRTRTITLSAERLPAASRPITLAVLSDLHLGTSTDGLRLNSALAIVRRVRPDAIICLGDLFDSAGGNIDGYADRLAALEAPLGKFAILGNHEFYAGLTDSLAFHRRAGFRVLRAEAVDLTEGLRLAGVDDPAGHPRGWSSRADEQALLPSEKRAFTILLKHRPDVNDDLAGRFDLQLSGHTHGGQFFPFLLITAKQFRFYRGFHPLPDGASVYVSCGSGTWGPPVRLLAPPEVTIICIRPPRHP